MEEADDSLTLLSWAAGNMRVSSCSWRLISRPEKVEPALTVTAFPREDDGRTPRSLECSPAFFLGVGSSLMQGRGNNKGSVIASLFQLSMSEASDGFSSVLPIRVRVLISQQWEKSDSDMEARVLKSQMMWGIESPGPIMPRNNCV